MNLNEKRIWALMNDLNAFCLSHKLTGDDCEKCPFAKYESCPLHDFYIKCWSVIFDNWQLNHKKEI
jgi:hypothetical protein